MTQTQSGKAFEYAIADALAKLTNSEITANASAAAAKSYLDKSPDKVRLIESANEAVLWLSAVDETLRDSKILSIYIQSDSAGKQGDVRDVIAKGEDFSIGFSAKNQHQAIKHSRLSDKIDFGQQWADYPVSKTYWKDIKRVFAYLQTERAKNTLFRELPDKDIVYKTILSAFKAEFERLCKQHGSEFIARTFRYLVGKHDFYKIISRPKAVVIQPFNLNGSLGYGSKWRIPNEIERIAIKPSSLSTLLISFAGGWQISFRLHNASSKIEPSLKFDINFVGVSSSVASKDIPLSSVN